MPISTEALGERKAPLLLGLEGHSPLTDLTSGVRHTERPISSLQGGPLDPFLTERMEVRERIGTEITREPRPVAKAA